MPRPEVIAARKLRRTMTLPEVLLWTRLRGGKAGQRFRRQHPVGPYVAAFACLAAGLVIEIDGATHDGAERSDGDMLRDRFMQDNGYRVTRIAAGDVLRDPDAVAASIAALVARPLHRPADGPPPRGGEDRA